MCKMTFIFHKLSITFSFRMIKKHQDPKYVKIYLNRNSTLSWFGIPDTALTVIVTQVQPRAPGDTKTIPLVHRHLQCSW